MQCFMNQSTSSNSIQAVSAGLMANLTSAISPDRRAAYEQSIQQLLLARLGVAVLEAMMPEDRIEYQNTFVQTGQSNSAEAQAFIATKVPNLEAVLSKESQTLIQEFSTTHK